MTRVHILSPLFWGFILFLPALPIPALGQQASDDEVVPAPFTETTTVTATLREVDTLEVPVSVSVIENLEERPVNNAAELLVTEAGVDVNGVGANQVRPVIRGQRGQRILFLQDGLLVNNPRRQADFGEITGVVDLEQLQSVEIVRGPSSVLYGSGAVGGVFNLITRLPSDQRESLRVGLSGRYSSADEQEKLGVSLSGRQDRLSYALNYTDRSAEDYEAASGSFGNVRLADEERVFDTGIEDESLSGILGLQATERQELRLQLHRYEAGEFGFGFVDPAVIDPDFNGTQTRIFYPFQDFERQVLSWSGGGFDSGLDTFDVRVYHQQNERELAFDAFINIGSIFPGAPPSDIEIDTLNFTDVETMGLRAEGTRAVGSRQLFTFGVDAVEDELENTDSTITASTFRFPFPPSVIGVIPGFTCIDFVPPFECEFTDTSSLANTPNAENRTYGVFVQDEIEASDRLSLIAGVRYQNVETRAQPTPGKDISGLDFDDDQIVGSVNAIYALNDTWRLMGSVGTAFRAPNIVERLFNGITPEGLGYQLLNPDLESETSEYIDLGVKHRGPRAFFEAVAFRNEIDDGIIQDFLSPAEIALLPQDLQTLIQRSGVQFVVQQRNVDRTTVEGVELSGGYRFGSALSVGGNVTFLDSERVDSDNPPTGDVPSEKYNAWLRWDKPRWNVEYRVRHNSSERAVLEPGDPVPTVGEELPSFTVHSIGASFQLFETSFQSHRVGVLVQNLTDELYAEFTNIGSFRPQPKRNVIVTYRVGFGR